MKAPLMRLLPSQSARQISRISPLSRQKKRRNSGLLLLLLLAQAYYRILECTFSRGNWFAALDLQLNHYYLWTTSTIANLLKHHEDLKDSPIAFEPLLPDLYPSNIRDLEWDDMVAPHADEFLGNVQRYVYSKGAYEPPEGSPAWTFVELFRGSVSDAIQTAVDYEKRMRQYTDAHRKRTHPAKQPDLAVGNMQKENIDPVRQRDTVFISYSHKDKRFLTDLLAHLVPLQRRPYLLMVRQADCAELQVV